MKQLVNVNLSTRTAKDWTPPVLTFGESLTLALRFFKNSEGQEIEADLTLDSLKASIGLVDARPAGGKCAIKIGASPQSGTNTTDPIDASISASQLAAKLNAVTATAAYGTPRVVSVDGSYLLFFGNQSQQVPLEVVDNGLWPVSFGRVSAWQVDGKWVHELRFTQAPVAFTSSHDVVLPPSPEITRIQGGGTDGSFTWNEIQQLHIPQEFRGSFIIKRGYAKSAQLSRDENTDSITAALQSLGADCFKVTLPLSQKPAIEFVGEYAGLAQELLVVEVKQAPAGDFAFTLALDRAELATNLRREGAVTLPLEITIHATEAGGTARQLVALTLPVTIHALVAWPDLEENPTLDLLRPYSPKTYVPFGANNELMGEKFYQALVGNGEAEEWVLATGLNSEVVYVFGRENSSGGRQLINGTDFSVTIDGDNQVTVTSLTGPPAADGWVFIVFSAQTLAQWAADLTVTVPQVIAGSGYPSLPDFMDNIDERVSAVEEKYDTVGVPAETASKLGLVINLPKPAVLLFYKGEETFEGEKKPEASKLPARGPFLLPALHDATVDDATAIPTDLAANTGKVFKNNAAPVLYTAPGGGIRSEQVKQNVFFACDGRSIFKVARSGSSNSYYPAAFERPLWDWQINDKQMAVNRKLEVLFGVQLQLLAANCEAQWVLVIESGTISADSSPSPVGLNIAAVTWNTAEPILAQALRLDANLQTHSFGLRIGRTVEGLTLSTALYGAWSGNNDAAPATANFALRARLTMFDTINAETDPRGHVFYKLVGALTTDDEGNTVTKPAQATIN